MRPAAGGGRWVAVAPERIDRWLAGFADRHGEVTEERAADLVRVVGADGAVAEIHVPYPPLHGPLVAHCLAERRVGVLLVRLGGYAAGVFEGPRLVSSKVGSRPVHGRSAAGGWSQQRFARRRAGQSAVALSAAADAAVRILLPATLSAVVLGGDRTALDGVLADPRLASLRPLVTGRIMDVPDPRLTVLRSAPFRDVWIRIRDPDDGPGTARDPLPAQPGS
ncbi:MAG TPA: acVLRF1 family peptidyl-tRNA hydrolase [Mycobacteriales bacterium]|jgi:hypothetical protein|nr:acVLRF1 family peptidyl-tRNA hydrolase [Mycobacteriales bacterium]